MNTFKLLMCHISLKDYDGGQRDRLGLMVRMLSYWPTKTFLFTIWIKAPLSFSCGLYMYMAQLLFSLKQSKLSQSRETRKSTVQNTTSMIVQNTCRSHKCLQSVFLSQKTSDLSNVHFKSLKSHWKNWTSGEISPILCSYRMWRWPGSQSPDSAWSGAHMQLTTLLEPCPTSLIWLTWDEQTATPAPARQWDTEPTSSHLNSKDTQINRQLTTRTLWTFRGHFKIPLFRKLHKSFKCFRLNIWYIYNVQIIYNYGLMSV